MLNWSRRRRHLSWIASLAILLAALAPWISQARGSAGFAQLMEDWPAWQAICSATDLDAGQPADPSKGTPASADHGAHCPFCLPHPGAWGLPVATLPAPVLPDASLAELPQRFLQAPATPHAWRSSQPRAPPAAA